MIVGFTCGAFDLLHPGHILLLKDAKQQCDYLIVALHVDPSVERPEKHRPIETVEERRMRLEACRYVDEVRTYNTEAELVGLLKEIRPDVRIIGDDWFGKPITGGDLPIRIHWHRRNHGYSSSVLRRRIAECADVQGKK